MDGEKGYNEEEVGNLLRLMEWIMQLPEVLEKRYEALLEEVKRARGTSFLASFERRALLEGLQQGWEQGLQQGLQQGLAKGLITLLTDLYGEVPESLREQIMQIPSEEILQALYSEAARAGSLEAFEQRLHAIIASQSVSDGLMAPPDA
jgi:flagellar biosynthesis/type III secretory pathway protein FliH